MVGSFLCLMEERNGENQSGPITFSGIRAISVWLWLKQRISITVLAMGSSRRNCMQRCWALKFAYSTSGREIVEFDYLTGTESVITAFPSPEELWARLQMSEAINERVKERLLTPFNHVTGKSPRYYQEIAVNRVVQAILQGRKRVLLTMATGTGKTEVAFQISWKLWSSRWNRKGEPHRKPKVLFLADRNFLVDDPKDTTFAPCARTGKARYKAETSACRIGGQSGRNPWRPFLVSTWDERQRIGEFLLF